jgi:DNA-directed RNA polymerase specialized sigma24 family protein
MLSDEANTETEPQAPQRFETTCWNVVLSAGRNEAPQATAALEQLCRTYWHPLYAYVRRRGYAPHDAQDLTQGFFAHLLEGSFPTGLEPAKGRFRSYMLAALSNYLASEWARANTAKRGGGKVIIPLDGETAENLLSSQAASAETPEETFDRRWAVSLLDRAFVQLREEYVAAAKSELFDAFKPFLAEGAGPGDYAPVAARFQMTVGAVAAAVHRLRLKYRQLVRAEIAQTVAGASEIDDEMHHLLAALT